MEKMHLGKGKREMWRVLCSRMSNIYVQLLICISVHRSFSWVRKWSSNSYTRYPSRIAHLSNPEVCANTNTHVLRVVEREREGGRKKEREQNKYAMQSNETEQQILQLRYNQLADRSQRIRRVPHPLGHFERNDREINSFARCLIVYRRNESQVSAVYTGKLSRQIVLQFEFDSTRRDFCILQHLPLLFPSFFFFFPFSFFENAVCKPIVWSVYLFFFFFLLFQEEQKGDEFFFKTLVLRGLSPGLEGKHLTRVQVYLVRVCLCNWLFDKQRFPLLR